MTKTRHPTYPHFIKIALNEKCALWRKRNSRLGLAAYKLQAIKCNRFQKQHFSHIEQRLLNNGSNKASYKYVNKKLCANKFLATLKDSAGNIITDDLHKANEFNAYFASVFKPSTNIGSDKTTKLNDNTHNTFPFVDLSPSVVYKAMRAAKKSLSTDPENIPSLFWTKLTSCLSFSASVTFNCSYKYSILPTDWKDANVLPLFKKGDPSLQTNY